jgi:hypothetical protein
MLTGGNHGVIKRAWVTQDGVWRADVEVQRGRRETATLPPFHGQASELEGVRVTNIAGAWRYAAQGRPVA